MADFASERDSVLRRVEKLLAIARDNRANEHEAANAAAMAERLMRKFNIDFAQEIGQRVKAGVDMGTEDVIATAKDNGTPSERVPGWAQWIAVAVARMHECGARNAYTASDKGKEACIRFYGYKDDVRVAAWTFNYLVQTVNRLCKEYRKDPRYLAVGRVAMNSYRNGMATAILNSINRAADEHEAEMQQAVSSRALVVVKQQAIEEKFGEFKYREGKSKARFDPTSYARGREKGATIDIRRGIEGNTGSRSQAIPTARRIEG